MNSSTIALGQNSMSGAGLLGRSRSALAMVLIFALAFAGLTHVCTVVQAATEQTNDSVTLPIFEPPKPTPPKVTNGRLVKVTVVNETGEPIARAEVRAPHETAFFGGANSPAWETDGTGVAEIRLGDSAKISTWFTMSIRHTGYAPLGLSWVDQKGNASDLVPSGLKTVLKRGVRIGGVVQDERGNPLPNVRIGLVGSTYFFNGASQTNQQQFSQIWSEPVYAPVAVSEGEGRWFADDVPADLDRLTISTLRPDGSTYVFSTFSAEAFFGSSSREEPLSIAKLRDQSERIVLKDGWSVHGLVLDPAGQPVSNVLIKEVNNQFIAAGSGLGFKTDSSGRFELRNRRRRQELLIASPDRFAIQSKVVDLQPEGTDVTFRLENPQPLRITVVDERDQPIAGARVRLDPHRSEKMALNLDLTADGNGVVIWTNAPLSDLALIASQPNSLLVRKLRVRRGDSRDAHLILHSGEEKEISISGQVVDSQTGKEVQLTSANLLTGDFPEKPQSLTVTGNLFRIPLSTETFRPGTYPTFKLQFTADGYLTFTSDWRDFDEGNWNTTIHLKRGNKPGGTLLLADGTPAQGAEVVEALRPQDFLFMNTPGKIWRNEGALRVVADEHGTFELKDAGFDALVLITHEEGFLKTTADQLRSQPKLTLEPWGRVEGVLKVGNKPAGHAQISLSAHNYDGEARWSCSLIGETDSSGAFSFEKVPPGELHLYRSFDRVPGPITETYQIPVTVKAGATTKVVYGGTGRPVIGQVEGNADWKNDVHLLVAKFTNNPAPPRSDDYVDHEEFSKAYGEYNRQVQRSRGVTERSYWVNFAADGSFRVEDVPAGTYELRLKVTEPLKPGEQRWGPVSADKEIASLSREVNVPGMAGGRSDEPLDLGTLELTWKRPQTDEPPVALSAQTLDGKPFSLETLQGKFLVLNFWTTWSENSQEQMAELSELSTTFKDDSRVVFFGVNLGDEPERVRQRVQSNRYSTPQLLLQGPALARATENLNLASLPSAFLLNPKGQVIARDLKGDNIERTLKAALKREGVKKK